MSVCFDDSLFGFLNLRTTCVYIIVDVVLGSSILVLQVVYFLNSLLRLCLNPIDLILEVSISSFVYLLVLLCDLHVFLVIQTETNSFLQRLEAYRYDIT